VRRVMRDMESSLAVLFSRAAGRAVAASLRSARPLVLRG
jgi:hypothetical protein